MVIWRDIGVRIFHKTPHASFREYIRNRKRRKSWNSFIVDCGDIPVCNWNETTGKMEAVVNNRGRAYAARRRFAYRRNKKKDARG